MWGCVKPPWRAKDVIFSVMHIPALPIGKRWACKERGWLRARGTEGRCARLRLPANTKDASQETLLSASTPFWKESWIAQSVWELFYISSSHITNISYLNSSLQIPRVHIFLVRPSHNKNTLWHLWFGNLYQWDIFPQIYHREVEKIYVI